jgi:hypothetical protein
MTPRERAERAKHLLEDELLREALAAMRESLVRQMESCAISDTETQHEIALMLQLRQRFERQLQQYVQDGVILKHEEKHRTFMERMRARIG